MKRAFVYGLGTNFAIDAIYALIEPANRYYLLQLNAIAVAVFVGLVAAAFFAFFLGIFLPPGRSWGRALLGGVLGYFTPFAGLLLVFALNAPWALLSRPPLPQAPPQPCSGIDCR